MDLTFVRMSGLFFVFSLGYVAHYSDCLCNWPSDFQGSTWRDSDRGEMVFRTSDMTGWGFDVQVQTDASVQTLNEWECVTYNDTYLVMRTVETFIQFVTNVYTGYRCLQLTKLTDVSYRYYEITPPITNLGGRSIRLLITEDPALTSIDDLCFVQHQASGSEFKVMIKSGSESAAKIHCPYHFLANHTFSYTESSVTSTCDPVADTGTMDMCSDVTKLAFVTPTCAATFFYSDADVMWCVDVVPVGTDVFVSLYNGQQDVNTIDSTTYYPFTCIGINKENTEVSITPNSCKASQTTNNITVDSQGNKDGSTLSISNTDTPCPPCPVLSDPFRGNVTISTSGAVTMATYMCESNYTLSGDGTRVCQSNGTWSGSSPSCACPYLSDPANGTVSPSSNGLTANFSCNVGTVLVGSAILTCDTATNAWNPSSPTCDTCQSLTSPENGTLAISGDGLTSYVTYSCNVGTTLNGDQTRTCQTTTVWDGSAPSCTFCSTLTAPVSGNVTISSNGTASIATYLCAEGYFLEGSNTSVCGTIGSWDTVTPTCRCESPPAPANGSISVSSDFTTVTYTCNNGTSLNGSDVRTCQTDGSGWSLMDPTCVTCPSVTVPTNGTYVQSTNGTVTMVTFSCDVGTSLIGDSTAFCLSDGTWSASSPNCSQCDTFAEPSSGTYTLSSNGVTTTATLSCDVGTTLSGDVMITCLENGTWSTTNSSISCVTCPALSSIPAGLGSLSSNGTSTTVLFECANGYALVGDSTSTCLSDGTWSTSSPTCVSVAGATVTESDSSLLPAVIVLAVLTAAFAAAFGILLYMYFRSSRENAQKSTGLDQQYDVIEDGVATIKTSNKIPFPHPPMGHQRHVLMLEKTNIASSRAPSGFSIKETTRQSTTPRSAASSMTLPLHLVREATSTTIHEQPPAPWTKHSKSTTPTPSDSISNQRTPRTPRISTESVSNLKSKRTLSDSRSNPKTVRADSVSRPRSPRKEKAKSLGKDVITPSVLSLEEHEDQWQEPPKPIQAVQSGDTRKGHTRKKKKSILRKVNISRSSLNGSHDIHNNGCTEDNDDTDISAVDIDDELNSSRRLYSSMYELLEKQENHLYAALNKSSSDVRNPGVTTNDSRSMTDRRGENRAHSSSPSIRATTPVKHMIQINDPSKCITPRSNSISTVQ